MFCLLPCRNITEDTHDVSRTGIGRIPDLIICTFVRHGSLACHVPLVEAHIMESLFGFGGEADRRRVHLLRADCPEFIPGGRDKPRKICRESLRGVIGGNFSIQTGPLPVRCPPLETEAFRSAVSLPCPCQGSEACPGIGRHGRHA